MLKADQIPPEVVEAAMDAWGRPGTMKDVIAAALSAWPGAELEHDIREEPRTIHLPILEASDE